MVATARVRVPAAAPPRLRRRSLWRLGGAVAAQPWTEAFVFFKHEDEARGPAFALRMQALAGEAGLEAGPAAHVTA